ncbi:MAG: amidohydrolase [Balneolaceae bacterium]|nr:amidohydrolase [Balneolaceae bacterium]
MKFQWSAFLVSITLIFSACDDAAQHDPSSADLVLLSGQVITVDENFSKAEAFAIQNGEFIAVGTDDDIREFIGEHTKVINADGKTVIPGLIESHVQATAAARREAVQPYLQLGSIAEIQEWLRHEAEQRPTGEWILLPRADVTRIQEGRIPTPEELDEAAPDHPAVFMWQFAGEQTQVLNSAALEAAGITSETEAPEGGTIHLNDQGNPTGVLENSGELTESFLETPEVSEEEHLNKLAALVALYNEVGITSVYERNGNPDAFRAFEQLKVDDKLTVRARVTMSLTDDDISAGPDEFIRSLPHQYRDGDDLNQVGPLMIRADGGILFGSAFMREAYGEEAARFYGFDDPENRGRLLIDTENLHNMVQTAHSNNWPLAIHVTGDAGVDAVLDAIEASRENHPEYSDLRFTIIHGYFPNPEAAERASRLGVGIDTQTAWYYKDGDALSRVLGTERIERFIGLQTWKNAGVNVGLNSDHMMGFDPNLSLNPYNPFLTMYTAITRTTEGGQVFNPDHRVSREEALRMMTINAAWLNHEEDRKGSIEPGKFGDFAILSDDFLTVEEERIKEIRSLLTVVDGTVVYDSESETRDP